MEGGGQKSDARRRRRFDVGRRQSPPVPVQVPKKAEEEGPPGRTLYDGLHAPDNFTDPNFLSSLQTNPHPNNWKLYGTVLKTSRVVLQFILSILFYIVYYHMLDETVRPTPVLATSIASTFLGYLIYRIYPEWAVERGFRRFSQHFPKELLLEHLRLSVIYLISSYQLAPILRTLTATISTDTIHAISVIMLLLHLFTCDYGLPSFMVSKALSVNAAVIGSICLTSRMASDYHSLALLTLAVQIFILFPLFSNLIWDSPCSLLLAVVVGAGACYTVSPASFLLFAVVMFGVIGVIPAIFISGLTSKKNIYGPWDEAVITPYTTERMRKKYSEYAY